MLRVTEQYLETKQLDLSLLVQSPGVWRAEAAPGQLPGAPFSLPAVCSDGWQPVTPAPLLPSSDTSPDRKSGVRKGSWHPNRGDKGVTVEI